MQKKAFTLAETLIAITVIGILAAMLIPSIIQNNNNTQYVTQLKKIHTNIEAAIKNMAQSNGCIADLPCTGLAGVAIPGDTTAIRLQRFGDELVKYIGVSKNCGISILNTVDSCFATDVYKYLDGQEIINPNIDSGYKIITSDGMSVNVLTWNNPENRSGGDISSPLHGSVVLTFFVDVNGKKPPNMWGRDSFWFYGLKNTRIMPAGTKYEGYDNPGDMAWEYTCASTSGNGYGCAARIIEEGWQMNY